MAAQPAQDVDAQLALADVAARAQRLGGGDGLLGRHGVQRPDALPAVVVVERRRQRVGDEVVDAHAAARGLGSGVRRAS
ncbi:MAG TPA: hypothetical protein VNT55_19345, partial [Baekduia sp.]|nr:hypothetical protein [Baekduia sp.]